MKLHPFYPIVDSAAWILRLSRTRTRLVQLRVKNKTGHDLHEEIRAARRICRQFGIRLVVNDFWEIAIDESCELLHLGQDDLKTADMEAIRRADIKIGISTHSEEELETALAAGADYIALGPIYPTILKKMPFAPQGLEKITQWKKRIGKIPLIAIGGITLERAEGCVQAGADVVAAVTDITLNENPEARADAWMDLMDAIT